VNTHSPVQSDGVDPDADDSDDAEDSLGVDSEELDWLSDDEDDSLLDDSLDDSDELELESDGGESVPHAQQFDPKTGPLAPVPR
jgi:hypothetical protein